MVYLVPFQLQYVLYSIEALNAKFPFWALPHDGPVPAFYCSCCVFDNDPCFILKVIFVPIVEQKVTYISSSYLNLLTMTMFYPQRSFCAHCVEHYIPTTHYKCVLKKVYDTLHLILFALSIYNIFYIVYIFIYFIYLQYIKSLWKLRAVYFRVLQVVWE